MCRSQEVPQEVGVVVEGAKDVSKLSAEEVLMIHLNSCLSFI